jgi:hypothetical protein
MPSRRPGGREDTKARQQKSNEGDATPDLLLKIEMQHLHHISEGR